MSHDTSKLLRQAKKLGAVVTRCRSGHFLITTPNGARVIASATPSDRRSLLNTRAQLRRAGLNI